MEDVKRDLTLRGYGDINKDKCLKLKSQLLKVRSRIQKYDLLHLGIDAVYGTQPRPGEGIRIFKAESGVDLILRVFVDWTYNQSEPAGGRMVNRLGLLWYVQIQKWSRTLHERKQGLVYTIDNPHRI